MASVILKLNGELRTENSPMSDTPPTEATTSAPMPRRLGIGLNVLIQIVLTLAIFFGINRLSYRYHTRWDLSPQQNYTVSSATLNYLDKLSKDVFIANVFARDSKIYGDVQTLLEEYRLNGRGRIKVRSIDPVRDIERAEALKAETGLPLDQSGVVVRVGSRTRFITEEELVVRENSTETQRRIKEFRGEDAITSAIINVVEGDERKFYIVVGKGARTEGSLVDAMVSIGELGRQQNFQLFPLNLTEVSRVPADADGVLREDAWAVLLLLLRHNIDVGRASLESERARARETDDEAADGPRSSVPVWVSLSLSLARARVRERELEGMSRTGMQSMQLM